MNELLPHITIETGANPDASIIWLHGLGASGHDFEPIVNQLNLEKHSSLRFIFPHAPAIAVTINNGYVMPAWFDLLGLDLEARQDAIGIEKSAHFVEQLIAAEMVKGISSDRIVLAGFSQGCALALYTGLLSQHRLAGIVALSGYLPLAEKVKEKKSSANANTPIFMAHGTQDNVLPPIFGEVSRKFLTDLYQPVNWHLYEMAHTVIEQEVDDVSEFLEKILIC
jgi:phospholipase/carboxylesterase